MYGNNLGKIVNSVDAVGKSKNGRKPSGMESHSEPGCVGKYSPPSPGTDSTEGNPEEISGSLESSASEQAESNSDLDLCVCVSKVPLFLLH